MDSISCPSWSSRSVFNDLDVGLVTVAGSIDSSTLPYSVSLSTADRLSSSPPRPEEVWWTTGLAVGGTSWSVGGAGDVECRWPVRWMELGWWRLTHNRTKHTAEIRWADAVKMNRSRHCVTSDCIQHTHTHTPTPYVHLYWCILWCTRIV